MPPVSLSRRERQIMDVLHRHRRATAAVVRDNIDSPPSYSAIRALLRILEEKGHVRHVVDGPRYVYEPVSSLAAERKSAIRHLVATFFGGSVEDTVTALVDSADRKLTPKQRQELAKRIAAARREGR